ncbi:MAG: hypothetical protein AB7P17_14695 [Nitrospirales bacterium]|nr:hypothetical protein [Nitrospirales bacterium]
MMMEFWVANPLLEMIFGMVSFLGVVLLGWSNLMVDPPKAPVGISPQLTVWERHRLRQGVKNED